MTICLGILEAGQNRPDLVPEYGTFAEMFVNLLSQVMPDIDFRIFKTYKGELPSSVETCQAYLITGSKSSVYDDDPWIKTLGEFVKDAVKSVPIVGICFGHQMLHHIFGGKVKKSEKGWGIGVHTYTVHEHRSWMAPEAKAVNLMASHQDQVIRPAPGSRTLAGSSFCPVAISEFNSNIMSIQPHPEIIRDLAREIFEFRREIQGQDVTDTAITSINHSIDDKIAAQWIIRFLKKRIHE